MHKFYRPPKYFNRPNLFEEFLALDANANVEDEISKRPLRSQGFEARTRPSRALRELAKSERSYGLRFSVARKYDNRGKRTTISD